jgi:multiple sugar transport system permease protein
MGYGASLAWIFVLIVMVLTLINLGLSRRWVYYEGD